MIPVSVTTTILFPFLSIHSMALTTLPSYLISVGILLTLMVVDLISVCPIKNPDNKNRKK
jgi:hypothetical protein